MSATVNLPFGTPGVEYREIEGFYGYYAVGTDGSIFSRWRREVGKKSIGNIWRKLSPNSGGKSSHLSVVLCRDGKKFKLLVHRLVLLTFVGPPPAGCEACHNDGDPTNNLLSNLRWGTHKENQGDRKLHGTKNEGSKHPMARLKEEDIIQMHLLYSRGMRKCHLAKLFKISEAHAGNIINRKVWRNVAIADS